MCSLVLLDVDEKKILASVDFKGRIQLWNLNGYVCMKTIQTHSGSIRTLGATRCGGKVRLTSASTDATFKIWDLQNDYSIKVVENSNNIYSSRVFMNGDIACIATGDGDGKIKLWME